MKRIVTTGRIPGIIAYDKQDPVGWCSIAPREDFPVLDRSPTLKRIDVQPVWSIVCLFITRAQRGKDLTHTLIRTAIKYAERNGAGIIEAYPIFSAETTYAKWELYTGLVSTFDKLGFKVAAQRSRVRPIMRLYL
ncbi:GNAT family N-acetyltransferase [candidate division WOR-3 bacterium]|nr:GNAT family N-acetyltransferase [candidate division WOR-3 bacterium]